MEAAWVQTMEREARVWTSSFMVEKDEDKDRFGCIYRGNDDHGCGNHCGGCRGGRCNEEEKWVPMKKKEERKESDKFGCDFRWGSSDRDCDNHYGGNWGRRRDEEKWVP
ncbi:hypothetical protein COCNU_scaffold006858G000020 [Cocos nucifera]|nr:hypothetical protein [Cocos nucifera]